MDAVLRSLLEWFHDYTYSVVFLVALIDATGIPFPGRLLLAAAGASAAGGHASMPLLTAVAALGAVVSDHGWYWAAVRGERWPLDLYCRLTRRQRGCVDDVGPALARYGALSIPLGRFFTAVRAFAWPLAVTHVSYGRFLALDVLGATVWSALWVGLGFIVGDQWESAAASAGGWIALASVVVFAAIALPLAWHVWRRRAARLSAPTETSADASRG
jgi:membrane protein DedA with SNARE-associated domain